MTRDQQAARVNVSDDEWIEFRTLAMRKRRSIADYLGELVRRELGSSRKTREERSSEKAVPSSRRTKTQTRLADQELLTQLPRRAAEPPPWET